MKLKTFQARVHFRHRFIAKNEATKENFLNYIKVKWENNLSLIKKCLCSKLGTNLFL